MKYLGAITHDYDLVNKKYVDDSVISVIITPYTTTGTNIADIEVNGFTTKLYAPAGGGGGTITDVTVNGTSVVSSGVAVINSTLVQLVRW